MEEATASYQAALTVDAARYLTARGISREAAVTHRLGVVIDPMPGHTRFTGMLAIPYLDKDGEALQLRFRCLEDHDHRAAFHGKYNSIAGDPVRLYGVQSIHHAARESHPEIHVTEGELDRLVLEQLGLHAIAVPGAALWRGHHAITLAGFNKVWVWGDPDDAGADFTNKITRSLRQAKGVVLRDGDVNETYLKGGAAAIFALIGRKEPPPWE
ncbi:toprim domain-containing protein [Actinoplanes sp. NPDC049548]|uniref:toprim domain-containing protein n=1 Tax=Actinoplanes sp. NPDC049548 TaxID=3155152 RepID=UPI00342415D9